MTTRPIFYILFIFLLFGCNKASKQQLANDKVIDAMIGDWELIIEENLDPNAPPLPPLPNWVNYKGMTISKDSIEFYLPFYTSHMDSITGKYVLDYLGNTVPYRVNNDSVSIKSLYTKNWEFNWKFLNRRNDTLQLSVNDSTIIRYKKIANNLEGLPDFDQIIYSSSGCYGSCSILDISITKEGDVLFQGEGYVQSLGFYSGNLNNRLKDRVFEKFRLANPLALEDSYYDAISDMETITTTFIKDGKIVKTIDDYADSGPKQLIWANFYISNIHNLIKLGPLPFDEPFYPQLHTYTFKKGESILALAKSESFYLWTELQKAKQVDTEFKPTCRLSVADNFDYWGPNPFEDRHHTYKLKAMLTDGQFYTFVYEDKESITYDLGYNFLTRNFSTTDFVKELVGKK